jgi:RES domain-containing protein
VAGGRWNHPGTPVVYTSGSLALACLEVFVHVSPSEAPGDLVSVAAEIPDGLPITRVSVTQLPAEWRRYPPPESLAELGEDWVRRRRTAVMMVPSVVVPPESNYVLNPGHEDFRRIRVARPEPFRLDERLWKRR